MKFKERDVPVDCGLVNVYNSPSGKLFWLPSKNRNPPGTPTLAFLGGLHNSAPYFSPRNYSLPSYLGKEFISTQGRTRTEILGTRLGFPDEPDVIMKDCYHRKLWFVNKPCSFIWRDATCDRSGYFWAHIRERLPTFYSNWINESHLIFPGYDILPCSRRAWYHLQPRFEGEISMLNFIYELKDFRDIAKYALKLQLSPSFGKMLEQLRKSLPGIASQPTKTAAELNLVNQFMIKPLMSDLLAAHEMLLRTVQSIQSQYAECGSKYQKKHYTEVLNIPAPLSEGKSWSTYDNWMQYGNQTRDTFTATLRYQYKYNVTSFWDAFSRYWGLRFTPEVIWNMIPFSFLVDYTIKIGQSLNALELDPNTILTKYSYCESTKRTLTCGAVGRIDPLGNTKEFLCDDHSFTMGGPGEIPISGYHGKVYHRYVTSPARGQLYVPKSSWPSGQQAINMAALLRCFL